MTDFTIPLGVADVKREGTDATIVARSLMVPVALKAAEELEKEGISCEVIDPRTIRPLDIDTIVESVKKTNRVVIAEESHPFCGVGAEISAEINERAFDYLDAPGQTRFRRRRADALREESRAAGDSGCRRKSSPPCAKFLISVVVLS